MKQHPLGAKRWAALLIFGLFGQLAWTIENMYFNVFVYNTITTDPGVIANMVAASAVTATLTTLLMGALSDRVGRRKAFIVVGYLLWGASVASFAFLSTSNMAKLFPAANAVQAAALMVVIMDCVMTFFGSSANDAAFNAWVTDVTHEDNRGRVESVLSVLPLVAMLIIFGGFSWMTDAGRWSDFFLLFGALVTAGGLAGLVFVRDVPHPAHARSGYFADIVYGFRPSVVRENPGLYITLLALGVFSASTQVFMPYLIIYIQRYLGMQDYALVLAAVLLGASAVSVLCGRLIDKVGKLHFVLPAAVVEVLGLLGMLFARGTLAVIGAGLVMLSGVMLLTASLNGLVRDYTPPDKAGSFQGIRMLFAVMLPMVTGPYLGAAVIRNSGAVYVDLGITKQVPTPAIFLASAVVLLFVSLPTLALWRYRRAHAPLKVLLTSFGEELDKDLPLPEYPRPQFRRSENSWRCLNGRWQYAIRPQGQPMGQPEGEILVPFSPESPLSGVGRQLKPGETLWYERQFEVTGLPGTGRLLLHFGAVDQRCTVLVNDIEVGSHGDGYLPFTIDITAAVREGQNTLTLAVQDDSQRGNTAYGKQTLHRGGIWYTAQSGIWQTVWLERVPDAYLASVKITPLPQQNAVCFEPAFGGGQPQPVRIVVYSAQATVAEGIAAAGEALVLTLPEVHLWSPEDPFLYDVDFFAGQDAAAGYFGMRSFGVGKDENGVPRLLLNGEPYFQNGLLDQGYWSDGLYTAPSDEAMAYDVRTAKELGFNMLRKHIKIEPARWYYHCDRLGMLVWQDMVSGGGPYSPMVVQVLPFLGKMLKDDNYRRFGRKDEAGRAEADRMRRETIELLYNTVSIGLWVPFNEGWGQFDALRAAAETKQQDPTRVVDHASGWHDQGGDDLASFHVYYKPVKCHPDSAGRPVVISEFGGYSYGVPGHCVSARQFGYRRYDTAGHFFAAYRELIEKEILPQLDTISAVVYTQLSDVEDEVNGLLTYDRAVCKCDKTAMKTLNRRLQFGGKE